MQVCHASYKGTCTMMSFCPAIKLAFRRHSKIWKLLENGTKESAALPKWCCFEGDALVCEEHCFHNLNNPTTSCVPNLHTKKHVEICMFRTCYYWWFNCSATSTEDHIRSEGTARSSGWKACCQQRQHSESFLKEWFYVAMYVADR